ncbi:DegT/DnrJ/EryC1/StrS family aminotransferase [Desulfatitalea alkaliphila]|uniref:DegT/DnrJ/EryC1/StrS family aminotransferase n=1 Tax=Desulfatitalea alkaliphila TaxID=2929485 RepID=A0AA41R6J2_9BACT|nr:DegT/DnrJ/EryC1/StrS family aminotransferase [Desulfatitalea alkaliphila]MCJ8502105.1 DegT/DnrJ/EryC1/StrS family aminotransferase [Desulfatitalea alkaliphila]
MSELFKKYYWYPPAETQIPWAVIFSGFSEQSESFSTALCRYLNVKHCVLGQSGRALLFRLLETLKSNKTEQRNEVLIPGYTCYSVAAAIAKAGLTITVYDLDPKTLYPDLDSLESAATDKTLAIIAQHLFGRRTPMDGLQRVAKANGAYLIEDSAQLLGRLPQGQNTGAMGDFGILSFGRGKPLPIGEGGALLSNDHPSIISTLPLPNSATGYIQPLVSSAVVKMMSKPFCYWLPEMLPLGLGETIFEPGFPIKNISETTERMASKGLPVLDTLNAHRLRLANLYSNRIDKQYRMSATEVLTSAIRYPVMLPIKTLTKSLKRLGVRRMYPNSIPTEKSIRPYLKIGAHATPGADEIADKLYTLPTHMAIDDTLSDEIATEINNAVAL